ncbi:POTRA domain-containing protein [Gemmata sp. JC717]|uniref:POTRA domain-containing protein n=1 Tax=Gemmata algarum TaxID=2975278 RepID=UPI0021BB3849|nr:POTRA domain-containing protein [Gemmata algarum]MDY3551836.1 POTRA domain-containing protein [Gemmata algarum]
MRVRILLVSIALAIVPGAALAQEKYPTIAPPAIAPGGPRPAPSPQIEPPAAPVAPPQTEKTVDDLLTELERLRAQQTELAKREKELTEALRKKLQQQTERMQKLGVAPKAPEPDRVGRILIEGNTNTSDKVILGHLSLVPGDVLHHRLLEQIRAKLQKAGFQNVTVEVEPCILDSKLKDLHIRVSEPPSVPFTGPELPRPSPVGR